jgi:hypothetical protein
MWEFRLIELLVYYSLSFVGITLHCLDIFKLKKVCVIYLQFHFVSSVEFNNINICAECYCLLGHSAV